MLTRPFLGLAVVAVFGWAASFATAQGSIVVDREYPVKDEQVRIRITDGAGNPVQGARVEVTYRPGSRVEAVSVVGSSASDGALNWTPTETGIATISAAWTGPFDVATSTSTTVSVKFESPPVDGILIMIVAGLLLVVGSAIRVVRLIREP